MRDPFESSLERQHQALVAECDRLIARNAKLEGEHKAWEETNGEVVRANFHLAARVHELKEALEHVRTCRECAETDFENCEGGRAALKALQGDHCPHGTHHSKPCLDCTKLVVALVQHDSLKARVAELEAKLVTR